MEQAKTTRFKIFMWDQFIRPLYLLLNIHQLQALLLALLILNFVTWKSILAFWILTISLAVIFLAQIIQYYKSGEFMHNYRKYKSDVGQYKDYRKTTKILKNSKKAKEEKVQEAVDDLNDEYEDLTKNINENELSEEKEDVKEENGQR